METDKRASDGRLPPDCMVAPIHRVDAGVPLRICALVRKEVDASSGPFILLHELPGTRLYLGAICDAAARVQEWVELWVQTPELRDLGFAEHQERLFNHAFDQRWRADCASLSNNLSQTAIAIGMEESHPSPILIKLPSGEGEAHCATVETTNWRLCTDDALLQSFGLPPYSTSSFRYLHEPDASGAKTFLAASADAPENSHVQSLERLKAIPGVHSVFNPHAGLVCAIRHSPLELDTYLQILEGRAWEDSSSSPVRLFPGSQYAALQAWSAKQKGLPFVLHGSGNPADRLNEVLFLKLSIVRDMLKEVHRYVKARQLPLLNLSPASFQVSLPEVGDPFPALWAAKCKLVKPGQAYPLKIKSTEQRYFIRLGRIEPSPFLPEGLGAHSFGIGSVVIRSVKPDADGFVLEGTLRAQDYLGLDPHDLLWFRLPVAEERLEFHAHVYTGETMGPKEARFRTVPTKLPESVVESLKRATGTFFQKSPYEIWPLLSSPCDVFSMGVIAVRVLLANSQSNLPEILDEVLSLARNLGKDPNAEKSFLPRLKLLLDQDKRLLDLVSPHALIETGSSPQQSRSMIHIELWLETVELVLRLFPGAGTHSYCKNFGDVSPLALETVFDRPMQEMESLLLRLRSALVPTLSANEEIAGVVLEQLANI